MKYKNRKIYEGDCRNASTAIYIEELDRFVYLRHKFGDHFLESIGHLENDDGYDLFIVEKETVDLELQKYLNSKELNNLIKYEIK